MKKFFVFFSFMITIFLNGCFQSVELPHKTISIKKNKLFYMYDDEYNFLQSTPMVIEKNNIIYIIFNRKIDNKNEKYAIVIYKNNGWKLNPLIKLSNQKYNQLVQTGYIAKIIKNKKYKYPLSYICFCKNNLLVFKIGNKSHINILYSMLNSGSDVVQSTFTAYIGNPIKTIKKFFLHSYWYDGNPNIISEEKLKKMLNFLLNYDNYLKPLILNKKIITNTEMDKIIKVVQITYKIEEGNPETSHNLYNKLKSIKIHGKKVIYDYTDMYPMIKGYVISYYLKKLSKAKNMEEVFKYINTYSVDNGKFYIDLKNKFAKLERDTITHILNKELNKDISEKNYKAVMKLLQLVKENIPDDRDFTGLLNFWPYDYDKNHYYFITLKKVLSLYFPKSIYSHVDLNKISLNGNSQNYADWTKGCIKFNILFHGGYGIYKLCGTWKNGLINKGKITTTYYSYDSWQTNTHSVDFNSYNQEKNVIYTLINDVIKDWNRKFDLAKQKRKMANYRHGIEIKNCDSHSCTILNHNKYSGVIVWNYEDNHYNFSLPGGWGIYYTDGSNELKTKCGKTEVNSLNEAIRKVVKCYYNGSY